MFSQRYILTKKYKRSYTASSDILRCVHKYTCRSSESPTLQQQQCASGDGRPKECDFLKRAHTVLTHVVDQLAGEVTQLME